jgi:hypothetical protein
VVLSHCGSITARLGCVLCARPMRVCVCAQNNNKLVAPCATNHTRRCAANIIAVIIHHVPCTPPLVILAPRAISRLYHYYHHYGDTRAVHMCNAEAFCYISMGAGNPIGAAVGQAGFAADLHSLKRNGPAASRPNNHSTFIVAAFTRSLARAHS